MFLEGPKHFPLICILICTAIFAWIRIRNEIFAWIRIRKKTGADPKHYLPSNLNRNFNNLNLTVKSLTKSFKKNHVEVGSGSIRSFVDSRGFIMIT